jgi:hypothetical protein
LPQDAQVPFDDQQGVVLGSVRECAAPPVHRAEQLNVADGVEPGWDAGLIISTNVVAMASGCSGSTRHKSDSEYFAAN